MKVAPVPYRLDERLPDASFPLPGPDVIRPTRELDGEDVWARLGAL